MERFQKALLEFQVKQNLECGQLMQKVAQTLPLAEIEVLATLVEGIQVIS